MKGYTAVQRKLLTTIFHIWKKDKIYDEKVHKQTSSMHERKPLFPLHSGENTPINQTKSAPTIAGAELDELPYKHVAESPLSVTQR